MSRALFIPRLAVIGVGLIAGSMVQALRRENAVGEVIGFDTQIKSLETAVALDILDRFTLDLLEVVEGADVIVLATPVCSMRDLLQMIQPAIKPTMTITDVGSVKGGIVDAAQEVLGQQFSQFVPGHPIAGAEKSGVADAFANLFQDHQVILTPTQQTDCKKLNQIRSMWQICGAHVVEMTVAEHDRILSITSHLPHILAFALMDFLQFSENQPQCYQMAAGGFYDISRIASSDPEMWRDICLMNGREICTQIDRFQRILGNFSQLIESQNSAQLVQAVHDARRIRNEIFSCRENSSQAKQDNKETEIE